MRIVPNQPGPPIPPDDGFHVIGLSLPPAVRQRLTDAFPQAIHYNASPDLPGQTQALCDLLGRVVLFTYLPAMPGKRWLPLSAVFPLDTVKVVGVHPHCNDALFHRALEAEFSGVIEADAPSPVLLRTALCVHRGELWFPRAYLSHRVRASASALSPNSLSEREAEILGLLARNLTNQEIADKLFITRDTVRWHLRSIYGKLGASDRDAALRLARNNLAFSVRPQQKSSA